MPAAWWRALPLRWIAAILLGAAGSFAFAPFYWIALFGVAFGGLLWLVATARDTRGAAIEGWWFGFGHFAVGLQWIAEAFKNHPDWPDWMGPPGVLLLAAGMALFPALAAMLARLLASTRGRAVASPALVPALAAAWTISEWLRGHVLSGFPWNLAASIWAGLPTMMQPLALVGPYALGLVTVLIAASPALVLPVFGGRRGWPWPAAALVLLGLWAGYGWQRLEGHPTEFVEDVSLRLVQANIPQLQKWQPELRRQHFADHLMLSQRHAPPEGTLLVIWPETAITDYRFDRQPGRQALAASILPPGGYLVTGAPRAWLADDGTVALGNSLFVLDDSGHILAGYDKAHLVPFAETMPARDLVLALGLDRILPIGGEFTPGPGPQTISLPGLPGFSPLICYEIIFPGAVTADHRPGLLLTITNDAWFGTTTGPYQHLAAARMRAVEQGLPVARVAGTGISAVIDPWGRILVEIPLGTRGSSDSRLPGETKNITTYAKFGDLLLIVILSLTIILATMKRSS